MTPTEADEHALRLIAAMVAGDFEGAARVGRDVAGDRPRDLAALLFALAGYAASLHQRYSERSDDPRRTEGYL